MWRYTDTSSTPCSKNEFFGRFGERLFYQLQKLDGSSKRFSRFVDRVNTRWLRMESRVAEGALLYARAGRVDRIFCGHTHVASHQSRYGIDYYNSGSWIDANPTYLTLSEQGVEIRQYEGIKYDYEPLAESAPQPEAELFPVDDLCVPASVSALASYESLRC